MNRANMTTAHEFGPHNNDTPERQHIYEMAKESFCLLEQYVHYFGKPMREEWLTKQAFDEATAVYEAALVVIRSVRDASGEKNEN